VDRDFRSQILTVRQQIFRDFLARVLQLLSRTAREITLTVQSEINLFGEITLEEFEHLAFHQVGAFIVHGMISFMRGLWD
jgi:hypothetical protein